MREFPGQIAGEWQKKYLREFPGQNVGERQKCTRSYMYTVGRRLPRQIVGERQKVAGIYMYHVKSNVTRLRRKGHHEEEGTTTKITPSLIKSAP